MTPSPSQPSGQTKYADRVYRSAPGLMAGVLLLVIGAWLGIDAVVQGRGSTPWLALAAMLFAAPLVIAFTLRPAVLADEDRMRVRNPFRTITLPWGSVASLRSGYSNEVVATPGGKYQLWAIPVSLRGRKRAARQEARTAAEKASGRDGRERRGGPGAGLGGGFSRQAGGFVEDGPARAESDKIMDDLRESLEAREKAATAQGEVTVRWAWEIVAPAVAGAVLLAVLVAVG
jgi:hypothetical protein